jgi:hypothetical protein
VHNRTIGNLTVRADPSVRTAASITEESGWPLSELDAGRAPLSLVDPHCEATATLAGERDARTRCRDGRSLSRGERLHATILAFAADTTAAPPSRTKELVSKRRQCSQTGRLVARRGPAAKAPARLLPLGGQGSGALTLVDQTVKNVLEMSARLTDTLFVVSVSTMFV